MATLPSSPGLLRQLHESLEHVSKAQQRVLHVILKDPAGIVNSTIEQIATAAQVSMPSVIRTFRHFGYGSFRDFMVALAQDLAVSNHHFHRSVSIGDPAPDVVGKIVRSAISSLAELGRHLDVDVLDDVARKIVDASRVDCYSVGATSAFMSQELQTRLFRLGVNANAFSDPHQQLISASSLDEKGIAFVISHVGSMPFVLEAAQLARSRGATVVALTQAGTPLALKANLTIAVSVPQDAVMRVSTEAYLAHLLVIEILTVRIAQKLGPEAIKKLKQIKQVLEQHGIDSALHTDIY
ncbi:MurR/RpiR family transcriptional regulator [Pollutimonas sp. M17]|uniref:MurR/RpiR family transcriptional regulator n=1 Tax=Pollutimonas sp. M17 TaxID=2962065 RepID=UPI0021F4E1A8|nr:MurR/RpiR family transcriptional regulator [Pollutimonas sp. M17]UYO92271.1 MurR/RpiR family transcriptional regulator [Pollutimonas sp. M17]HWK70131.1 MurR/RpiR family transcriptional regulator [Burkholderiaceae bacterium]